ncbi:unnamed protein product [Nesidiocoris tenuis]|uniref:Dit-like phage tail protein N-terminal domain-containing protein n=1 Tax=Nesidiocoris tenuis TaxID=355587 RepID=A0A6H5GJ22_9HEMI|nr:unnamed protein product [Nesidiocoris tenuis]
MTYMNSASYAPEAAVNDYNSATATGDAIAEKLYKVPLRADVKVTNELNVELDGRALDSKITEVQQRNNQMTVDDMQSTTARIIQPVRWSLTGAVSNNPLKVQLTDFLAGGLSNLSNNPYVAAVAGLAAGFLAGSNETRASTTLEFLINLMRYGEPFDVDAGDIQLKNMVISRIGRTKDMTNETGLIFVCELQELITLDRLQNLLQPRQIQLRDGDPTKSALAGVVKKGQQIAKDTADKVSASVNGVLDGIF